MKDTLSRFHWGERTFVMGILNITPDSFSGDGLLRQEDVIGKAVNQARQFVAAGADILDIGGESTRPGSEPVSTDEELSRVLPVIEAVAKIGLEVPISLDTYKADVAEAGLKAGADWLNDVWGLKADPRMASVAGWYGVPLIVMHNRSQPADAALAGQLSAYPSGTEYQDLVGDIKTELLQSISLAHEAGIPDGRIIIDPGIGFGKTVEQNIELIARLDEFKSLGYPILLGPSRKSFIGKTLDLPPDQRLEGTLAAVGVGIAHGADIIRVHDVQAVVRYCRMADAMIRKSSLTRHDRIKKTESLS